MNTHLISEKYAWPVLTRYENSKTALKMATCSLTYSGLKNPIRVGAIPPAATDSERNGADPNSGKATIDQFVPLQHVGDIHEIADIAKFLISEDSRYIIDETVDADGGLSLIL